MRKYKEELVARLQNDSKSVMEDGVEFIVKPIPEIEKTSGMDPRMLKAAKEKIGAAADGKTINEVVKAKLS